MFSSIQAKETRYNRFHFRSRAEARFAVMFDVLGVKYEYEPEKFNLGDGSVYIPDFWLPDLGQEDSKTLKPEGGFVEVKGAQPTDQEIEKADRLRQISNRSVYIVYGSEFLDARECWTSRISAEGCACIISQCPLCGRFGFNELPEPGAVGFNAELHTFSHMCFEACEFSKWFDIPEYFCENIGVPSSSPMLDIAREAAKSARFESPEWLRELDGIVLVAKRMREQGLFCHQSFLHQMIAKANEWRTDKDELMFYREPWWFEHRHNMEAGITPCPCWKCTGRHKPHWRYGVVLEAAK